VNSVDQLLKVRQGSLSLKRNIADLNKALRKTGDDLADKVCDVPAIFAYMNQAF
jgi:hypothetical protein